MGISGCSWTPHSKMREKAEERWDTVRGDIRARLASDQLAAGNPESAAQQLAGLKAQSPDATLLRARVALARGDVLEAEKLLAGIPADAPQRGSAAYLLGVAAQQRLQWNEARAYFEESLSRDDADIDALVALTQTLLQLDLPQEALTQLDERAARFGWLPAWHAARAECCERLDRWEDAVEAWRRVVDTDRHSSLRERLALALYRVGRYDEAILYMDTLTGEAGSLSRSLRLVRARCLFELDRLSEARSEAQHLLREDERDISAMSLLACIYARDGEPRRALSTAERMIELSPRDAAAVELAVAFARRAGDAAAEDRLSRRLATLRE